MDDLSGDLSLAEAVSSPTVVSTVSVPTSQSDFNTVGISDVKDVLTSGSAAVTSIAGAIGAIKATQATSAVNAAIAANAQSLGIQQASTQGKIAQLQNQTALAQAQAAYNKAAGIVSGTPTIVIVLAVAGLVIAAAQLVRMRKK